MNTTLANKIKNADFAKIFKNKGYAYFTNGIYNLNIIGIRSNQQNKVTNIYDDILVVEYNDEKGFQSKLYTITTEPGTYCMKNPSNAKGTAILVPGQYRGVYKLDLHRGKYKALCQRNGTVKVYRDGNKDDIYDLDAKKIDTGWFGINIHRSNAAWTRSTIDQYSAGCQVFNSPNEFNDFMKICDKAASIFGNKFTYTLITENDLEKI